MDRDRINDYIENNMYDLICDFFKTQEGNQLLWEMMDNGTIDADKIADNGTFYDWATQQVMHRTQDQADVWANNKEDR